jgi:anti-sigma factor RsiW
VRCEDIENLLVEYASDELAPAILERVQRHLESCASCRRRAQEFRSLLVAIWDAPRVEPAQEELAAARSSARRALAPQLARRLVRAPLGRIGDWAFVLASLVVLALAIALQTLYPEPGLLKSLFSEAVMHPVVLALFFVSVAVVASFLPICLLRKSAPNGAYNGLGRPC